MSKLSDLSVRLEEAKGNEEDAKEAYEGIVHVRALAFVFVVSAVISFIAIGAIGTLELNAFQGAAIPLAVLFTILSAVFLIRVYSNENYTVSRGYGYGIYEYKIASVKAPSITAHKRVYKAAQRATKAAQAAYDTEALEAYSKGL